MRIGLYGGCFNPVHEGHLTAAREARDLLDLDQVIFIPSGSPPLKGDAGLVSGAHRLSMLRIALADEPGIEVSSSEIDRRGPSFTADTVLEIRDTLPGDAELFFLLGDDCVDRLPRWKDIDLLHTIVRFAILPRTGGRTGGHDPRLIWLACRQFDASSTQVRHLLQAGQPVPSRLLPDTVADYINTHDLYPRSAECARV